MGANAVTTVPVYTAGEVLTAADLNITNSGIPVFASTVERDAAFGGTGEKTLAEGQFAYLEDTNTTQYYDGAAWQPVGTTPGLVYLTGASFSAASSVSLPTNTFSSTYQNYKVVFLVTAGSGTFTMTARFRTAGSDNTNSNYSSGSPGSTIDGVAANLNNNASSSFNLTGGVAGGQWCGTFDVMSPQVANYSYLFVTMYCYNGSVAAGNAIAGEFNVATQFDAMTFIATTHTMTGNYKVYGYSNS